MARYYGGVTQDASGDTYCAAGMAWDDAVVAEIDMDRYIKGPYAYAQYAVLYPIWGHRVKGVLYLGFITSATRAVCACSTSVSRSLRTIGPSLEGNCVMRRSTTASTVPRIS